MGIRTEEITFTVGVARAYAQGINISTWAMNTKAVGSKSVDFGVGIFYRLALTFCYPFNPFFDDVIQAAEDLFAQLSFSLGFIQAFIAEVLQKNK